MKRENVPNQEGLVQATYVCHQLCHLLCQLVCLEFGCLQIHLLKCWHYLEKQQYLKKTLSVNNQKEHFRNTIFKSSWLLFQIPWASIHHHSSKTLKILWLLHIGGWGTWGHIFKSRTTLTDSGIQNYFSNRNKFTSCI